MTEDAHILIVDLDPEILRHRTAYLKEAGYEVSPAATGEEGFRMARDLQPHLILVAANLPDDDAVECCRRLKADPSLQEAFVVLLSPDGTEPHAQARALENEADAVVSRTLGDQELLARIRTFLRIQRTEKRLRASEARYRNIFETAPIGIYRTTADGQILMANAALVDMLGYDSFAELAGRDLESQGYHPDYPRSQFKEHIEEQGEVRGLESAWRRKDGSTLFIRENARPVYDEWGEIVGYQGTVEDVTQRVLRTQRLERLNAVLDAVRDVNQLIVREPDRNSLIEGVCRHLVQTRGYRTAWIALFEDQELLDIAEAGLEGRLGELVDAWERKPLDLCGTEALSQPDVWVADAPTDCELADVYRGHKLMAVRLEHAEVIHGVLTVSLPRAIDVDDREKSLLAEVAADIAFALHSIALEEQTEEANLALQASERRQSLILNTTAEVFTYQNPDLEVQWANQAAAESIGLSHEELIGRHCYELWGERTTPCEDCPVLKALETGEPQEAEHRTPDGRVWHLRGQPIFGKDGEVEGLVEFAQDITERREAQRALQASEKRHRVLFESTGTATCVFGDDAVIQLCNEKFAALAGLPKEQIEGEMAWRDFVAEEDLARMDRYHAQRASESGTPPREYEFTFVDAAGEEKEIYLQIGILEETGERVASLTNVTPLKRAEDALRESEDRYRTLFESAPESITLLDLDGTVIDCNPTTEEISGIEREELVGRPFMALGVFPADELVYYMDVFARIREGQSILPLELKHELDDGRVRWLEAFPAPIIEDGQIQAIQVIARDITERKEAEEALRRMQALLNQTQVLAQVGGWEYDVETEHMTWTDEVYRIYGVDPAEFDPNDIDQDVAFYAPQDRARITEAFLSAVQEGEPYDMELSFHNAQGERLWVRTLGQPERRDGEIVRVFGHLMDITERKRAEEALRENEQFLRQIIDTSPNCIFVTDRDGRYVLVNEAVADLYDLSTVQMLGKTEGDLAELGRVSPEEAESFRAEDQRVLATGKRQVIPEAPFTRADGATRWFHTVKVPLSSNGAPDRVLGVAVDITERKRTQEALQESQRQLATLMSNLPGMAYRCKNDPEWTMEFVSGGCHSLTGYGPQALTGQAALSFAELIEPEDRQMVWDAIQEAVDAQRAFQLTYRITTADGRLKWVWEQGQAIFNERGDAVALEGFITDITERKRSEESIREKRETLALLNDLNQAANRGDTLDEILQLFNDRTRDLFSVQSMSVYLLSSDREELVLRDFILPPSVARRIEKVVGHELPSVRIPVSEEGVHADVLQAGRPQIIEDLGRIEQMMAECTGNRMVRKLVPIIHRITGFRSVMFVPIVVDGKPLGLVGMSNHESFSQDDLERLTLITRQFTAILRRKSAEEALRQQVAATEASIDGIAILDQQGRYVRVNQAHAEIYGYPTAEALLDKTWRALYTPASIRRFEDQITPSLSRDGQWRGEAVGKRKDGSTFPQELSLTALDDGGVVCVVRDITERKRAEERTEQLLDRQVAINQLAVVLSETRDLDTVYRTIYDRVRAIADGWGFTVSSYDRDNDLIHAEYAAYDGVEVDVSQFPPLPLAEPGRGTQCRVIHTGEPFYAPDYREAVGTSDVAYTYEEDGTVHEGSPPETEEEVTRSAVFLPMRVEGEVKGIIQLQSPRYDAYTEGQRDTLAALANVAAVAVQNAQLWEQTRQQARRLQQTIDTVPTGVFLLNADRRVILSNPVAERDLAVLAEAGVGDVVTQLGGRPMSELLTSPPSDQAWHELEVDERVFEAIARPMARGSNPEHWVVVLNDVTEEREVREQLHQQERLAAVGQLAGGIAHDFNNILASIILYAQMPLGSRSLGPETEKSLRTILEESHRAADLVQQVLDFSRSAMMETEPLSLASLVEDTLGFLRRTIPENVRLKAEMTARPCVVQADTTRIHQVLTNLALNAKDAMPDGGELRLQVDRVTIGEDDPAPVADMPIGSWARLSVSDTGTGMTEEVQDHLFEPFFTTKEAGKGTGLGLAQVYGIVKQHQGFIDVETAVGEGTTFTIYLPLMEEDQDTGEATEDETPALEGQGETVLVVEDAERLRRAVEAGLLSLGYQVITAANGRQALETVAVRDVDLVLTDVVMPEMGGKALLHNLRKRSPHLKVIAMTGHVMDADVPGLRKAGFSDALPKPFSIEELTEIVRDVLDRGSDGS